MAKRESSPETTTTKRTWFWGALLAVLTLAAYFPTLGNGYIWDDAAYVYENSLLPASNGLVRIWLEPTATPQYYPLVHTMYWFEYRAWGLTPFGYHLVNMLLHATAAILLWILLKRLSVPGAWLAAAVFALHPVQVESVAWVAERKNVLSGCLAIGSLLAYLRFINLGSATEDAKRNWKFYGLALVLFVLALFSKTVTSMLPFVILLIVWWKQGTVKVRDIVPVIPMIAIGAAMAWGTVQLEKQHVGASGVDWNFTLLERTLVAGSSALVLSDQALVSDEPDVYVPALDH